MFIKNCIYLTNICECTIYYANNLIKFIAVGSEKFNQADDGFDGFLIRAELLKSRTNKAGQFCHMIYNQASGFDPILTQYKFAKDNELIDGRNPYQYIKDFKDIKFSSKNFREEFIKNEKLRFAIFDKTIPILEKQLSKVDTDQYQNEIDITTALLRLADSQANETFEKTV
jgi:hypothetical protein